MKTVQEVDRFFPPCMLVSLAPTVSPIMCARTSGQPSRNRKQTRGGGHPFQTWYPLFSGRRSPICVISLWWHSLSLSLTLVCGRTRLLFFSQCRADFCWPNRQKDLQNVECLIGFESFVFVLFAFGGEGGDRIIES